jgi:hypothetical protein
VHEEGRRRLLADVGDALDEAARAVDGAATHLVAERWIAASPKELSSSSRPRTNSSAPARRARARDVETIGGERRRRRVGTSPASTAA